MTRDEHVKYWIESANHDYQAMQSLFRNNHYVWSLFAGHLVVEKLLKAYHAKQGDEVPPRTHNLLKLAETASLELTANQSTLLDELTAFNIRARYPDFKHRFYRTATQHFTNQYIQKITEIRQWLLLKITN